VPLPIPEIQWVASSRASGLHAAEALRRRLPLADEAWQNELKGPVDGLSDRIASCGLRQEMVWRHLHGLTRESGGERQLAEQALRKVYGLVSTEAVQSVADGLTEVARAVERVQPRIQQELPLRIEPLRQQWEARGPGLLRQMAVRIDEHLLVKHAEVILVHPVLGGGGESHLLYDSLRLEAVLYHPIAELPETLRLAWLVAQLNQELPGYSDAIDPVRLHDLAAIALVPAALMSAEYVDLARFDEPTLALALQAWHLPPLADNLPALVWDWWHTYFETRPPWRIALQALDHLLKSKGP
jgi:hypothetical protein